MYETGGGNGHEELRLHDGTAWREVEGAVVVLHLGSSTYFEMNPSGAALWPLLAAGATRKALSDELIARYGISEDQAAADVEAFVTACREHDLLRG
jgi:hypothetical protein